MRLTALAALALATLSGTARAETFDITVMPFGLPEYMSGWVNELEQHPAVLDGTVKLTVLDGQFDANIQSNQMDTAITRQADAVIFAPIDADAAAAPVARATLAGIPVISSVTAAKSDELFAYIGTNDVTGGRLITEKMVEMLGGKGNVVILEGPIGNSPQLRRREGIDAVLAENPEITLLAAKTANWSRAEGLTVMENWLSLYGDQINGVIAQNDEMALGAIQAIEAKGFSTDKIRVVSIDGIKDGLRAAKDKGLFTLYKPAHFEGQGALDLALRAVAGDSYEPKSDIWTTGGMDWAGGSAKQYEVPWVPVTAENVDELLGE